jgi:hypothetical protein
MGFYEPKLMRQLRREGSTFTLEPASNRDRPLLCRTCGMAELCPVPGTLNDHAWVELRVRSCNRFIPIVTFIPPIVGLGGRFNTLRLGDTWERRVEIGSRVALFNNKTEQVLGYAAVEGVFSGPFEEVLRTHAENNHLIVGKPGTDLSVVEGVLRGAYGKFLTPKSKLTALYLRRIDEEEGRAASA